MHIELLYGRLPAHSLSSSHYLRILNAHRCRCSSSLNFARLGQAARLRRSSSQGTGLGRPHTCWGQKMPLRGTDLILLPYTHWNHCSLRILLPTPGRRSWLSRLQGRLTANDSKAAVRGWSALESSGCWKSSRLDFTLLTVLLVIHCRHS